MTVVEGVPPQGQSALSDGVPWYIMLDSLCLSTLWLSVRVAVGGAVLVCRCLAYSVYATDMCVARVRRSSFYPRMVHNIVYSMTI